MAFANDEELLDAIKEQVTLGIENEIVQVDAEGGDSQVTPRGGKFRSMRSGLNSCQN